MIIKDARIYVAGTDYSGVANNVSISREATEQDATTMESDGNLERVAGLVSSKLSVAGLRKTEHAADATAFDGVGLDAGVFVVAAAKTGARAWAHKGAILSYTTGGKVGELLAFSADVVASGALVEGSLRALASTVTADGEGDAFTMDAIASTETLVVAVEVFAHAVGTTGIVSVESSADGTFTDAVTVASIPVGAVDGYWEEVAGPNTDTHYRLTWSLVGASPSLSFSAFVGRR